MLTGRARWRDLPVRIKGLIVIGIPVLPLILTSWLFFAGARQQAAAEQLVSHTWQVKLELERIRSTLVGAETAVRGALLVESAAAWETDYRRFAGELTALTRRLEALVADNPEQQQSAQRLSRLVSARLDMLNRTIDAQLAGEATPASTLIADGTRTTEVVLAEMDAMTVREDRLLAERQAAAETLRFRSNLLIGAGAGVGVIAGMVCAWVFLTSIGRRLGDTRSAAVALGEGRPIAVEDDARDEVGVMVRALNRASVLLQEQTRRADERMHDLSAVNQELEAFSYSVSHDLRAPLRHVAGFAALLRKAPGTLTDQQQRYIATIVDAATRMGRLIDDLLAFSRTGRTELRFHPIDLSAMVEQVRGQLRAQGEGERVEWRVEPLPVVRADPAMLRVVLDNLLGNAVKYSSKRERPVIEVGSTPDPESAVFYVRDNGVGFDMQYAGKLFGVFQRLHSAEEYEGTGIGLATVRRIVSRHGGRTWAEGEPGKGATFYIALPRRA